MLDVEKSDVNIKYTYELIFFVLSEALIHLFTE